MTARVTLATARRVLTQLRRDHRTMALMLVVPVVLLVISFALLLSIGAIRHFATRHDRD